MKPSVPQLRFQLIPRYTINIIRSENKIAASLPQPPRFKNERPDCTSQKEENKIIISATCDLDKVSAVLFNPPESQPDQRFARVRTKISIQMERVKKISRRREENRCATARSLVALPPVIHRLCTGTEKSRTWLYIRTCLLEFLNVAIGHFESSDSRHLYFPSFSEYLPLTCHTLRLNIYTSSVYRPACAYHYISILLYPEVLHYKKKNHFHA